MYFIFENEIKNLYTAGELIKDPQFPAQSERNYNPFF